MILKKNIGPLSNSPSFKEERTARADESAGKLEVGVRTS